jgi:polar amino acid transport system substrate-binding protein
VFGRSRVLVGVTALAAAGAMTLTGCASSGGTQAGGGGNSGGTTPTTAAAPAPVTEAPSVASTGSSTAAQSPADLVPASIKSKGTLSIAMDATYPPDEFIAKDGHTIVGWDADFGKALAQELGMKAKLINVTFDSIIPRLQSGTYDIGLSSFTDTKEREKTVDFVTYYQAGMAFYDNAGGKTYNGIGALCGLKVSVENGTTELDAANAEAKKCKAEGKPAVTVLTFQDQNAANLAVASGRADLGFADSPVAGYIVSQSHGQFQLSGKAFGVAPYGIALPKGNGMAPAVLAAVKAMIADGSYGKILKKWGAQAGAISNPVINGATS